MIISATLNKIDQINVKTDSECNMFFINKEQVFANFNGSDGTYYYYIINRQIEFGKDNYIEDNNQSRKLIVIDMALKDDRFDDMFYYDKNDLGPTYFKTKTIFKIWAPIASNVSIKYFLNGKEYIEKLTRTNFGVYEITINKNMEKATYVYLVTNNGITKEVVDLYAYSATANNKASVVVDLNKILIKDDYKLPIIKSLCEASIYECSVRDFSSSLPIKEKGTFVGFIKENLKSQNNNPIGFDYIKQLGVSHIQLMPITEFATTDDLNYEKTYNWGYDPCCYNIIKGAYSTNPNDPYCRIKEFKKLVSKLHENKLRITLDMVFNHTYRFEDSIFNNLVPNYFYLMDENKKLSNGSLCGNDLDTTRKMLKKYIVDMCVRFVNFYHVDGFRLDLMGILTIDLVNEIYDRCKKINKSFILYGEGWYMPTMLNKAKSASLSNQNKLPNIGFFNDIFRKNAIGSLNGLDASNNGFLNGNTNLVYQMAKAMRGSIEENGYFSNACQSINYVECHDNLTLQDKLLLSNKNYSENDLYNIRNSVLASICFANGCPFFQNGMEFARSKQFVENSYKSGDKINTVNWENVDKYQKSINALKDFLEIRKQNGCFKISDRKTILNNIDLFDISKGIIRITYAYDGYVMVALFNGGNEKYLLNLDNEYRLIANENGAIRQGMWVRQYTIKSHSFTLFAK